MDEVSKQEANMSNVAWAWGFKGWMGDEEVALPLTLRRKIRKEIKLHKQHPPPLLLGGGAI